MRVKNLGILVIAALLVFSGVSCKTTDGASGGSLAKGDVFRNGKFASGVKLGESESPVAMAAQRINVTPVAAAAKDERVANGFIYSVIIDFEEAIDISGYNGLNLDWEGMYAGNFGGTAMSAYITTSDGKKTGVVGVWQQAPLGKVLFSFSSENGLGKVNDGELKEDEIAWEDSDKTCKSIEIQCDFAMRAGGEDEDWDWFALNLDEMGPWSIRELKFF